MKRMSLILSLLAGLLIASTVSAVEETSWGTVKQAVSGDSLQPAAKPPTQDSGSEEPHLLAETGAEIKAGPGGELLLVYKGKKQNASDDLKAHFLVPSGALDKNTYIAMKVYVTPDQKAVVAFAPGGLVFNVPAILTLHVGTEWVDLVPSEVTVRHEYGDGTVEEAVIHNVHVLQEGDIYKLTIQVPGFSRYSMGGGA